MDGHKLKIPTEANPSSVAGPAADVPTQALGNAAETAAPGGGSSVRMDTPTLTPAGVPTATGGGLGALPAQFGRYRIVKKIGEGGMGAVYLAHDTQLDRQVALKVPRFQFHHDPSAIERFYREARAAATFHHANLCPVYDVGELHGIHYLTMAYIEGTPLADILKENQAFPAAQAVDLLRQTAAALDYAHRHGVVHRDLKPSNIMITASGAPVIMDFGLAARIEQRGDRLTRSGDIMGTPAFMPPEQVRGNLAAIGPASDVYSLGVILYQLLAGRLPFEGTAGEIMAQILTQEPAPLSAYKSNADPRLSQICLTAMAAKIEDRYRNMAEFEAALATYQQPKSHATDPSAGTKPDRRLSQVAPAARRPAWLPLVVAATAIVVVLAGGILGIVAYWNFKGSWSANDAPGRSIGKDSGDDTQSQSPSPNVPKTAPEPAAPAEVSSGDYALLIGVNQYDNVAAIGRTRDLLYADADATELADALRDGGYPPANVVVMTSQEVGHPHLFPRAENIRQQLRTLTRTQRRPKSLLVAFSGYEIQVSDSNEYYLCPSDANSADKATMISLAEVYRELEQCPADSKLVIIDSCRDLETTGARNPTAARAKRPHEPPDNIAVLFACSRGQFAHELPNVNHGLLTHYLIRGLRGNDNADKNGDGEITQFEILSFLQKSVDAYARQHLENPQTPEVMGETLDRAITRIKNGDDGLR